MAILYCHIYIHYEAYSRKEPCFICLIKSYDEGDTEVFEEEEDDGEET